MVAPGERQQRGKRRRRRRGAAADEGNPHHTDGNATPSDVAGRFVGARPPQKQEDRGGARPKRRRVRPNRRRRVTRCAHRHRDVEGDRDRGREQAAAAARVGALGRANVRRVDAVEAFGDSRDERRLFDRAVRRALEAAQRDRRAHLMRSRFGFGFEFGFRFGFGFGSDRRKFDSLRRAAHRHSVVGVRRGGIYRRGVGGGPTAVVVVLTAAPRDGRRR